MASNIGFNPPSLIHLFFDSASRSRTPNYDLEAERGSIHHWQEIWESIQKTGEQLEAAFEWAEGIQNWDAEEAWLFVNYICSEPLPNEVFVFRDHGIFVGLGALRPTPRETEVQLLYWTDASHQRRGVATEVARWLTDIALNKRNYDAAWIIHQPTLQASAAIAKKLRYEHCGVDSEGWHEWRRINQESPRKYENSTFETNGG